MQTFSQLPVGHTFMLNGNLCTKASSRTAQLASNGRSFYVGKYEQCDTVQAHHNQVRTEPTAEYRVQPNDDDDDVIVARAWAIIGRRARTTERYFTSPDSVKEYLSMANAQQADAHRERFGVVFLDNQNGFIEFEIMAEGTISQTSVYPREIVRRALQLNASAVILTHNHPSGCLEFSSADIKLTNQLKASLELVDVRVLDHVVTCPGTGTRSMAETGLI